MNNVNPYANSSEDLILQEIEGINFFAEDYEQMFAVQTNQANEWEIITFVSGGYGVLRLAGVKGFSDLSHTQATPDEIKLHDDGTCNGVCYVCDIKGRYVTVYWTDMGDIETSSDDIICLSYSEQDMSELQDEYPDIYSILFNY